MFKRHHFKQTQTLEYRLSAEVTNLRKQAEGMPPCIRRDELLRKARQAETAAHLSEWLRSPELEPPK